MTQAQPSEWLTVQEVAEHLRCDEETVRRWIRADKLPALALGGRRGGYRIRATDLHAFIERQMGTKAVPSDARAD